MTHKWKKMLESMSIFVIRSHDFFVDIKFKPIGDQRRLYGPL